LNDGKAKNTHIREFIAIATTTQGILQSMSAVITIMQQQNEENYL
jgi:hypothetical protein